MEKRLCLAFTARFSLPLLCLFSLAVFTACENRDSKVEQTIKEYLKTNGAPDIKDVELILFHTDSNAPEKAYASARLVYASGDVSSTEPQKNMQERSGYILKQEGGNWVIQSIAKFTDRPEDAAKLLSGEKIRR